MSAYDILAARGVNRLCHFTKFQSLTHIIPSEAGQAYPIVRSGAECHFWVAPLRAINCSCHILCARKRLTEFPNSLYYS